MKKTKTIVAGALSLIVAVSATTTVKESVSTDYESKMTPVAVAEGIIEKTDYEIYSVPATVKVLQDDTAYPYKQAAKVEYNAVINEYENYQLVISAKTDISSYSVEIADLKDGAGNTFSKDNFEVYNMLFFFGGDTNLEKQYAEEVDNYYPGYYPDALIPVEYAQPAGDMKVKKDNNAILWFTVYVPKTTAPGLYTGTFTLTVGGQTEQIPVSLNVNDYVLTDDCTLPTSYGLRYARIAAGELDNSPAMIQEHFDFYQKYRMALKGLPIYSDDVDEYLDAYVENYDKMSAIPIMTCTGIQPGSFVKFYDYVKEELLGLAALSSPERNYLDKAYFYLYDEPNVQNPTIVKNAIRDLEKLHAMLANIVLEIKQDISGAYDEFKQIPDWEEFIIDIDNVVPWYSWATINGLQTDETIRYMFSLMNTWAVSYSSYGYSGYGPAMVKAAEELGCRFWFYTAGNPIAPANHHIANTNLLNQRTMFWTAIQQNFGGYLYWDSSAYWSEETKMAQNVYKDASSASYLATGDGNLTYPGAPYAQYGAYGPLPSIRVMSVRDGMEEYEMLVELKDRAKTMQENGLPIDVDGFMDTFFTQVLDRTGRYKHLADLKETDFGAIRATLINYLQCFKGGLDVFVMNRSRTNDQETVRFYVEKGATISATEGKIDFVEEHLVEGTAVGSIYDVTYDLKLGDRSAFGVTIASGEASYQFSLMKDILHVPLVDLSKTANIELSVPETDELEIPNGSTADDVYETLVKSTADYGTNGLNVRLTSVYEGLNEEGRLFYRPAITFTFDSLGERKLSDFTGVVFEIDNAGAQFNVYTYAVYLNSKGEKKESKRVLGVIAKGEKNFSIALDSYGVDVDKILAIKLTADNGYVADETTGTLESLTVYEFTVKQILGY